jgi:hypothetical protein
VNSMISTRSSCGTGDRLRASDCFFIQFPLEDRLPASFPREVGIQLSLRFIKGIFRICSRTASGVVRFFNFLDEELNFRINWRRFTLPPAFSRQSLVGGFDLLAPTRFRRVIQLIQGGIRLIRDLPHFAFSKKPGEDRPLHGFSHQFLGFFDFRKFPHGVRTITLNPLKVQYSQRGLDLLCPNSFPTARLDFSPALQRWKNAGIESSPVGTTGLLRVVRSIL